MNEVEVTGLPSIADVTPEYLTEWSAERNSNLSPKIILAISRRRVWWKCPSGHEYVMNVAAKIDGEPCPICGTK